MAGKNKGLRLGRAETQYRDTRTFLAIRIFNFTKNLARVWGIRRNYHEIPNPPYAFRAKVLFLEQPQYCI